MNKFIKSMVVAAVLTVSLISVAHASAAAQFAVQSSSFPSDYPLVQVKDCPSSGYCSSSGFAPSVSGVQPGDHVAVMLYYRNVGDATAINTRFTLNPQTTGSVSSQTFTGSLVANNASTVSGSATVNLSQAQTLTYSGINFYENNQGTVPSALPNGQSGSELFNGGGLSIGDIASRTTCPASNSFCHQGTVVVTYIVGQTVVPPVTQTCQINNFNANPSTVASGASSVLTWNTSGCTTVTISGTGIYNTNQSLSGNLTAGPLFSTSTYILTAYGANGQTQTSQQTVNVNQAPTQSCYINNFTANPNWVSYGGTSSLVWSTTGCTSVTISGPSIYNVNQALSGTLQTGAIYGSSTYTLTAYGQNGQSVPQTVTVSTQQQTSCSIPSFYASPATVTSGGTTTLYWTTSGATSVSISGLNNNGYYNQALSGSSITSAIYGTQTYTLTANCQNGQSIPQTITVSVNQPVALTSVYTGQPGLITQTSARLNGVLSQSGNYSSQVYFQWGTTQSLGFTTNAQTATATTAPFFDTITGLSPNTTYYYRAVATNSSGTFYGDIQGFSTPAVTTVVPPTVITTVVQGVGGSGSNLVSLDVNQNQPVNACVGNIVNYLVTYKNISGHTLNNAVLQVLLPQDVDFQSSNPGIYNASDHTITLSIGTLAKDQQGTMYVSGVVLRSAINRNLIVASATIAFTNPVNNSQESAVAYGLGNTNNCTNSLAGLALFGNGFWPTTLIGWLALILILLLLIYLASLLRNSTRNNNRPVAGMYAPTSSNRPMNMNGNAAQNQPAPHYEDMDIPTYNNH